MLDYGTENIYSDHWAKSVAWQRHYCAFWKQSCGYCDWRHPDLVNAYQADNHGACSKLEHRFYNDVTGANISFVDGMEEGRKILADSDVDIITADGLTDAAKKVVAAAG